jgi:hypothetical protein
VQAVDLIATDNFFATLLAPVSRVLGGTLLGVSVAEEFPSRRTETSASTGTGIF